MLQREIRETKKIEHGCVRGARVIMDSRNTHRKQKVLYMCAYTTLSTPVPPRYLCNV